MGVEVATYISQLISSNPVGGVDPYSTADDHIRLIKSALLATFPNFTAAALTPTQADLNTLLGAAGAGLTPTIFGYLVGTTSSIQTQLNAKLSSANDQVANANLANMAQSTVKGRAAGSGTGDPVDLTAAQIIAILLAADGNGSSLDADTVDGQHASAFAAASHGHAASDISSGAFADARIAQSNVTQHQAALGTESVVGSTIARRTSAGYLLAAYFNQNSAQNENPSFTQMIVETGSDGYFRKASNAHVKSILGIGTMASRSVTIQNGGSPSGGADGDIFLIW